MSRKVFLGKSNRAKVLRGYSVLLMLHYCCCIFGALLVLCCNLCFVLFFIHANKANIFVPLSVFVVISSLLTAHWHSLLISYFTVNYVNADCRRRSRKSILEEVILFMLA